MFCDSELPLTGDDIIKHTANQPLCPNIAASPRTIAFRSNEGAEYDADT
jgi:hypothetical protein